MYMYGIYMVYTVNFICIYHVYTIYIVYIMYIPCIYMVYTWIYNLYHVPMLHLAPDVAEEDRVPFHRLHQQ